MTLQTVLLDLLLQRRQPPRHQMYILNNRRATQSVADLRIKLTITRLIYETESGILHQTRGY